MLVPIWTSLIITSNDPLNHATIARNSKLSALVTENIVLVLKGEIVTRDL